MVCPVIVPYPPTRLQAGLSKTIYEFGTVPAYGYRPYSMANLELQWEKRRVLNFRCGFRLIQ